MARRRSFSRALSLAFAYGAFAGSAAAKEPPALDELQAGAGEEEDSLGEAEEALGPRGNMRTRAESVSFDPNRRRLELSGNVRVDAPPFHLRSQHVVLERTKYGIEADGAGRLAFCPCLGTPLTVEFDKAIVAPPGDLILKNPKLEVYDVPVAWLPWFWMRSDEKLGALPPDIAYRGQDGFFLGEGVHLPWKDRGAREVLDLRGGAYLTGGFVADTRLRSPVGTAKIRYDRHPGVPAPVLPISSASAEREADDGLLVDARGSTAIAGDSVTVAWDADVLRGRRGVAATTELDAAARPWDRAAATGSLRVGPITVETGFRAVTRRGGALTAVEASGPFSALRASGALGGHVTYDATVEGGALRTSGNAVTAAQRLPPDSVSYGRAELGALAAATAGPLAIELRGRGAGNLSVEATRAGGDRAGSARLRTSVPLARPFFSDDPALANDPLIHVVEPFAEAAVVHAAGNALLGSLPGRGLAAIDGTAPLASGGVRTSLGRWARREALELTVAGGGAFGTEETSGGARPLARGRLAASFGFAGAQIESGHVFADHATRGGSATVASIRVGRQAGLRLLGNVATLSGVDPVLARALTDAPLEAPAGFLARSGTTGGAGIVVPWMHALTTTVGADADATQGELVAARAGVELRDRCNCVALRMNGAHRVGREGVDVWFALDFTPER